MIELFFILAAPLIVIRVWDLFTYVIESTIG